jgi:hypothetical protein
MLDDALGPQVAGDIPVPPVSSRTFLPPHPLLFFRIQVPVGMTAVAEVTREGRPPSESAHVRLFTVEERRALDLLIALGATLRPDFTTSELRRQYRLLARRLHPDRHPTARAEERVRLSRAFAAATESYRLLSAVVVAH